VLVAIGQGWTNAEIAERLVLTESTVKKHLGRVLAKIGARPHPGRDHGVRRRAGQGEAVARPRLAPRRASRV
jgi:DNA-binding NarL/FixJ family response regulator